MSDFYLSVHVNPNDLATLKAAGYKLCIAKKVNNKYNTVWKGGSFLAHNQFKWTSRYEVFATETFEDGALVSESTDTPEIKYGQSCLLDKVGNMGNAKGTPNTSGTFSVINQYMAMNIGVRGYLGGKFSPIFVSPEKLVTGKIDLTPVESVLVWFDTTHVTSTIITSAISNTMEVEFTGGKATRSVSYAGGAWLLDHQLRLAATYDPQTNLFAAEKPSQPLLRKMASFINDRSLIGYTDTAFKATVEFSEADVEAGVPQAFADYAKGARPSGLEQWGVSTEHSAVVVRLALEEDYEDATGAEKTETPNAFLSIIPGWTGAAYKKLTFEAPETAGERSSSHRH
ncbi:hypothetical protein C2E23DRAFT_886540 [Lenzites betulinus]|nr:hypothetical protein C2E23DRAFT_886531 [Lenzites betulinus]KAH9851357.1 hypothetical protein C2E23DRAFT_886540 [Lenzites betulinus]